MAYSCPATYVGRDYVDPAVPQLVADLSTSLTIKGLIYLATLATVDGREVLGDLLIPITRIRRS